MEFLINPNFAYVLIVTGVMLSLWTFNEPKSTRQKAGMVVCFVAVGYELFYLNWNPLALLIVAISPLPLFLAIRQARFQSPLFLLTILMLTMGSVFLFVDRNNLPVVNYGLAAIVSVFCATFIWIGIGRMRNADGIRPSTDPDSVVGLMGVVQREIELYSAGSVLVDGELWQARSKKPIPAGATVRVLRQDGFWLTVKEVQKLLQKNEDE
ncbi:MAG TPA: NfeD family protein [Anaerolineales bacterium]|nr:NfeD family protein [Anaerolineales bacterium]